ncbi:MAG: hypothetical protein LW630_09885 [Saprospiraceae bacterium]|nr:hypothetical protein [Saprospiraceae bacterium]
MKRLMVNFVFFVSSVSGNLRAKKVFGVIFSCFLFLASGNSQFGVRTAYTSQQFPNWSNALNSKDKLFGFGVEAGVNYWFSLKKKRIEFYPELTISRSFGNPKPGWQKAAFTTGMMGIQTQIYALDLGSDCDCPTFSKQGPSINKGLFFLFTVAGGKFTGEIEELRGTQSQEYKTDGWVYRAGLGLGLDIGFSDLVTLTPHVTYVYYSGMDWRGLSGEDLLVTDHPRQVQAGVRVSFRPDYGRRRR